ncbi:MAG: Gfo/Idh/MocA family oxidoreductase [Victivallaceae bacterium]|nr:Gfo/Idh/MocA family oxidoreductase [Victivallaceae bacterium]
MTGLIKVLVVGCGNMGASHARAYKKISGFEVVGVVSRSLNSSAVLAAELGGVPQYDDFDQALSETRPDAVAISTYPDTHAAFAIKAMEAGAHVFIEKPIARNVAEAEAVVKTAELLNKKVVIGYILRHHPSWIKFIELGRTLGKPLVMRMNLNQCGDAEQWKWHQNLMRQLPPIVDCGVHYIDVMCQVTRSKPVQVQAVGARLTEAVPPGIYNYGQLQVKFADGSVGWYEAGWGPMMSENAHFIKDIIGPRGCVSIVSGQDKGSADIDRHTKTNRLKVHYADMGPDGKFSKPDEYIDMSDEPGHQELCDREQTFFLKAIHTDLDLTKHLEDAVNSLKVVIAADQSVKTGKTMELS